ncbi:putative radical SAM superfamily protein [Salmonella phage SPFM15]|nr:putative radical SAM superfamily protein [Salmonella phage SPFM5]VFR13737.1 putative radical SAM superfamily protein [Salmonella phage SPFM15]
MAAEYWYQKTASYENGEGTLEDRKAYHAERHYPETCLGCPMKHSCGSCAAGEFVSLDGGKLLEEIQTQYTSCNRFMSTVTSRSAVAELVGQPYCGTLTHMTCLGFDRKIYADWRDKLLHDDSVRLDPERLTRNTITHIIPDGLNFMATWDLANQMMDVMDYWIEKGLHTNRTISGNVTYEDILPRHMALDIDTLPHYAASMKSLIDMSGGGYNYLKSVGIAELGVKATFTNDKYRIFTTTREGSYEAAVRVERWKDKLSIGVSIDGLPEVHMFSISTNGTLLDRPLNKEIKLLLAAFETAEKLCAEHNRPYIPNVEVIIDIIGGEPFMQPSNNKVADVIDFIHACFERDKVVTNLSCNLDCEYCYERKYPRRRTMSNSEQQIQYTPRTYQVLSALMRITTSTV